MGERGVRKVEVRRVRGIRGIWEASGEWEVGVVCFGFIMERLLTKAFCVENTPVGMFWMAARFGTGWSIDMLEKRAA